MTAIAGSDVRRVVVACDAGMGSSVLLTSQLSRRFKPLGIEVVHSPVHRMPADAQVVVCHEGFIGDPAFDRLEKALRSGEVIGS